jgi:hypothetical protein
MVSIKWVVAMLAVVNSVAASKGPTTHGDEPVLEYNTVLDIISDISLILKPDLTEIDVLVERFRKTIGESVGACSSAGVLQGLLMGVDTTRSRCCAVSPFLWRPLLSAPCL